MTFVSYDVCRIMTFVGYDICRIMMFVDYDVLECVAQRVCGSAYTGCLNLCEVRTDGTKLRAEGKGSRTDSTELSAEGKG